MTLVRVDDLRVRFTKGKGVHAVNGATFTVRPGEAVAIVGESGSGKSVTALSLLGLLPRDGVVASGTIDFRGQQLHTFTEAEWRAFRGRQAAMIFQDPGKALNPTMRVGRQIAEAIERHVDASRSEARQATIQLLEKVGLAAADARKYPHEMSGGQRQRVMIAVAIACDPQLLIADEPTTALDVTTQAQIISLVKSIQSGMAVLWITHDLALAATLVDRVLVMYAGRVVEESTVERLFRKPGHPYTQALLAALPSLSSVRGQPLTPIDGDPPILRDEPIGCAFAPRCAFRVDACSVKVPEPERRATGHYVSCHRADDVERSYSRGSAS